MTKVGKLALAFFSLLALLCGHGRFAYTQPLAPVTEADWGLKIVIFDVGQGDAALLLTPDGEAALIDMGRRTNQGTMIADYLLDPTENGAGAIDTLKHLFVSHYDADHIRGAAGLDGRIEVEAAYDQGPSFKRDASNPNTVYHKYVRYVGDSDGNGVQDPNEPDFVRHEGEVGQTFTLGEDENVSLSILSINGDTAGPTHDLALDPSEQNIDENPGSMILLVTLGRFEYLTTGDATSDDWKGKPDTEEALIDANAIPGGDDIDVLKVAHHGSDTSSGRRFIESTRPEIAVISSDLTSNRLPKLTTLKILELTGALVLVTGIATDEDGNFHQSGHAFDDGYQPSRTFDEVGTITILVATDGSRYTVRVENDEDFIRTFSSIDSSN